MRDELATTPPTMKEKRLAPAALKDVTYLDSDADSTAFAFFGQP